VSERFQRKQITDF